MSRVIIIGKGSSKLHTGRGGEREHDGGGGTKILIENAFRRNNIEDSSCFLEN